LGGYGGGLGVAAVLERRRNLGYALNEYLWSTSLPIYPGILPFGSLVPVFLYLVKVGTGNGKFVLSAQTFLISNPS
jgi:hypothetical protein